MEEPNSQQQLQLELWQSPPLSSPAFTEYVVVILQDRVSVCGAGDIDKDLDAEERGGSEALLGTTAHIPRYKYKNYIYSVKHVAFNFPPVGAVKGGDPNFLIC